MPGEDDAHFPFARGEHSFAGIVKTFRFLSQGIAILSVSWFTKLQKRAS